MTDLKRVPEAIWTPWAQVLCSTCNNAMVTPGSKMAHLIPESFVEVAPEFVGKCDGCKCPVGSEGITVLANIARAIGGHMEQTGGMCAAAVVVLADGRTVVVTGEDPDEYVVGVYAPGAWEEGTEGQSYTVHTTAAEALTAALAIVNPNRS